MKTIEERYCSLQTAIIKKRLIKELQYICSAMNESEEDRAKWASTASRLTAIINDIGE